MCGSIYNGQNYNHLIARYHDGIMFRILATLAFAVSLDLILFDSKYTHAVEQMANQVIQHWAY